MMSTERRNSVCLVCGMLVRVCLCHACVYVVYSACSVCVCAYVCVRVRVLAIVGSTTGGDYHPLDGSTLMVQWCVRVCVHNTYPLHSELYHYFCASDYSQKKIAEIPFQNLQN